MLRTFSTTDARRRSRSVHRRRRPGWRTLVALFVVGGWMIVGTQTAQAHEWASWHWHRGGSAVQINVSNGCGTSASICDAARKDIHNRPHPVYLTPRSYHTDVSMLAGNAGNTGWVGLAQMVNYSYPHVTHGHATLNLYYRYGALSAQGVMCQEVAHTLGLDHAPTGDCMGKGYYAGSTNYFGRYPWSTGGYSHPSGDLKNMYSVLR